MKCARWKIESCPGIEMRCSGEDHNPHGQEHSDPKAHGNFSNGRNLTVKQKNVQDTDADDERGELRLRESREQIAGILLHANIAGCNFEWAAQQELPNKKE